MENRGVNRRGLVYRCCRCGCDKEKRAAVRHILEKHLEGQDIPYLCEVCGFRAIKEEVWQKHMEGKQHKKAMKDRVEPDSVKNICRRGKVFNPVITEDPNQKGADLLQISSEESLKIWEEKPKRKTGVKRGNEENQDPEEKEQPSREKNEQNLRGALELLKSEMNSNVMAELEMMLRRAKADETMQAIKSIEMETVVTQEDKSRSWEKKNNVGVDLQLQEPTKFKAECSEEENKQKQVPTKREFEQVGIDLTKTSESESDEDPVERKYPLEPKVSMRGIGAVCLSDSSEEEIDYVDHENYQPVDWSPILEGHLDENEETLFAKPTPRKPRESYKQESLEHKSSDNPPGDSFEERKRIQVDSTNDTLQSENKEQKVKQEHQSSNGVTNSANTLKRSYREMDGETGEYIKHEGDKEPLTDNNNNNTCMRFNVNNSEVYEGDEECSDEDKVVEWTDFKRRRVEHKSNQQPNMVQKPLNTKREDKTDDKTGHPKARKLNRSYSGYNKEQQKGQQENDNRHRRNPGIFKKRKYETQETKEVKDNEKQSDPERQLVEKQKNQENKKGVEKLKKCENKTTPTKKEIREVEGSHNHECDNLTDAKNENEGKQQRSEIKDIKKSANRLEVKNNVEKSEIPKNYTKHHENERTETKKRRVECGGGPDNQKLGDMQKEKGENKSKRENNGTCKERLLFTGSIPEPEGSQNIQLEKRKRKIENSDKHESEERREVKKIKVEMSDTTENQKLNESYPEITVDLDIDDMNLGGGDNTCNIPLNLSDTGNFIPLVGHIVRECITSISSAITAKVVNQPAPFAAAIKGLTNQLIETNKNMSELTATLKLIAPKHEEKQTVRMNTELRTIARSVENIKTDIGYSANNLIDATNRITESTFKSNITNEGIKTALQSQNIQLKTNNDILARTLEAQTKEFRKMSKSVTDLNEDLRTGGKTTNLLRKILDMPHNDSDKKDDKTVSKELKKQTEATSTEILHRRDQDPRKYPLDEILPIRVDNRKEFNPRNYESSHYSTHTRQGYHRKHYYT